MSRPARAIGLRVPSRRIVAASAVAVAVGLAAAWLSFARAAQGPAAPPPDWLAADPGLAALARPKAPKARPRPPAPPAPPIAPARIRPILPAQTGDGVWRPADSWAGRPEAVLTTSFHFNPLNAGDIAYVTWIRASRTQLALYPGYAGPGPTSLPRGPEEVPAAARGRLLATFNSGFYEKDAPGGFYANGILYYPMRRGLGTVVAYRDGTVDVMRWRGGARPGRNVVVARQNLPLIVGAGRSNPALDASARWGDTLHEAVYVWRSGLGVDRHGNLVYVAAPDLAAPGLARLLVHAGAVRAMELDINPAWPILATFGGPGARSPALAVPNPNQVADRFLFPSKKDFFAVYLRAGRALDGRPG